MAANRTAIAFERLMGQKMTVELSRPVGASRYFHGLVSRFGQDQCIVTRHWRCRKLKAWDVSALGHINT